MFCDGSMGEELDGSAPSPAKVEDKTNQMDLTASLLASMRQEMAQRATELVEQACLQTAWSSVQACHLEEVMQSNLGSLRAEMQQYTDQACDNIRSEQQGDIQTHKGKVQSFREEMQVILQCELATLHARDAVNGSLLSQA